MSPCIIHDAVNYFYVSSSFFFFFSKRRLLAEDQKKQECLMASWNDLRPQSCKQYLLRTARNC